jgi:hypothetical protein
VPLADLKPQSAENGSSGVMTLEEMERRHIFHVLNQTNWVFSGPNGAAAGEKRAGAKSKGTKKQTGKENASLLARAVSAGLRPGFPNTLVLLSV